MKKYKNDNNFIVEMTTAYNLRKYRKLAGGFGILTLCGLVYLEKRQIEKYLNLLVDRNVLEVDKKRPDYIYIKYHIYRESMRKLRLRQEQDANWINVIIHPFGKWWKTFKHSVAWRLLHIAQNCDKNERLKAIRQLAQIDHLKDWDFRHLAQICDARTAVSLARSGCDSRWFVPVHMHGVVKNPKMVVNDLHKMLEKLLPSGCVQHFFSKYFTVSDIKEIEMGEFTSRDFNVKDMTPIIDLLKECVAFLYHITKNEKMSKQIINDGGLITLMELEKIFKNDNETLATLCKTMANLSLAEDCVNDFFISGWVTILANWRNHPDLRLQVIASKALANLDYDDIETHHYPPNIFPLYPRKRQMSKPKADVIFVHGLLGGVFITWRQKDKNPSELGLYGKNAFYTSEADDVFLVGEAKRNLIFNNKNGDNKNLKKSVDNKNLVKKESISLAEGPVINKTKTVSRKILNISDAATKELVETLESSAELDNDWEVVYPDCPLKSNSETNGEFSIAGNNWINDDNSEEYTNCWPMDWLPADYPNIRILGIDYKSAVTEWSTNYSKFCPCEKDLGHIDVRSDILLERLVNANVGENRPIIWVGHSMGGILCKHILLKAMENSDEKVKNIAKNTKGLIFLGTPHRGSSIAKWKQHMQMIISPSIEVKELEENEPKLLNLHDKFMKTLRTKFKNLSVVSIAEGEPTMLTTFKFPLRIVTEESAYINFGDFYVLKDDHLSLSKPIFRQSFLYQRLLKVIEASINEPVSDKKYEQELSQKQIFSYRHIQLLMDSLPGRLFKFISFH